MATETSKVAESEASTPSKGPHKDTKKESKAEIKDSNVAAVGTKFAVKTEQPAEPGKTPAAFAQNAADDISAGNQAYTLELKEQGRLGLFLTRTNTSPGVTFLDIDPVTYLDSLQSTLLGVTTRLLKLNTSLSDMELYTRADFLSANLANGCVIMTYLKFRAIILSEGQGIYSPEYLRRPRVSIDLPIPAAFAFAIQQFGTVHIADLSTDLSVAPRFYEGSSRFGLPHNRFWNPNAYNEAVEYARKIGMQFNVVDLKVKNGTAWWLLKPVYDDEIFELQCTIPEVNFTDAMSVTRSLFISQTPGDPLHAFVDLSRFEGNNYGTMMRNPHFGINLSTFEAVSDIAKDVWTHV